MNSNTDNKQNISYANITGDTSSIATPYNSTNKFLEEFIAIINPSILLLSSEMDRLLYHILYPLHNTIFNIYTY